MTKFENREEQDKAACNELPHLGLHLGLGLWILNII